ncbi:MAG: class I SAM-dependent methyltransferase [Alsobacter sp.]
MNEPLDLRSVIEAGSFDFIDFGCSKGGSLRVGAELFGGHRGLGLDIDPAKVAATRGAGFDAMQADITALGGENDLVSFVLMLHFLEHLPGYDLAKKVIEVGCSVAKDFVYIRHPWFDADGLLFDYGLKFFWSDWTGHPNHFGKLQFYNVVGRIARVHKWWMFGYDRVVDSRSRDLVSLTEDKNSQGATQEEADRRQVVVFPIPVFRQIACLIQINPDFDAQSLVTRLRRHEVIHESRPARRAAVG